MLCSLREQLSKLLCVSFIQQINNVKFNDSNLFNNCSKTECVKQKYINKQNIKCRSFLVIQTLVYTVNR